MKLTPQGRRMMSDIQSIIDALQQHLQTDSTINGHRYPVEAITCRDGARFSIQASHYHYCTPRTDTGPWTHVEVMPLGTNSRPTCFVCENDDVAGYVPIEDIAAEIMSRGCLAIELQQGN